MIDPHVHLRDWKQKHKETVEHGLWVAYRAGLDGVFEMPNTDPALISRKTIEDRIKLADDVIRKLGVMIDGFNIFHGLYAGITAYPEQIKEVVEVYNQLFPRVVGLKLFAGQSTGNMGVIDEDEQRRVYRTLLEEGYKGVLAVHCEKEAFISGWDIENPFTHTTARPSKAEIESLKDQITFAGEEGFSGKLHIVHVSTKEALELIENYKRNKPNGYGFDISCGITPHHSVLYDRMMDRGDGLLLKMNPPLRDIENLKYLINSLLKGDIDWIETDHAPHTLNEKMNIPFASGIPVLPFYPYFIKYIMEKEGMNENKLDDITHNNIVNRFGIDIINSKRTPDYSLAGEYEFNPFRTFHKFK